MPVRIIANCVSKLYYIPYFVVGFTHWHGIGDVMLIDLQKFLSDDKDSIEIEVNTDLKTFSDGFSDYEVLSFPKMTLKLSKAGDKRLACSGKGVITLSVPCDRCLKPVESTFDLDIDEKINFSEDANEDENAVEKDYIDGYCLNIDELINIEILISKPVKTLCKEDCKGLCPVCGTDLNVRECGCDRSSPDPRMSVFKDILNNFKEV